MKRNNIKLLIAGLLSCTMATTLTSCKNGDADFPDYEGGTSVYFAYQTPVRTIELGDDEQDLTLDHAHKCMIKATFGGSTRGSNGTIQVAVDPTLVNGLTFEDGTPVKAMPENYYQLQTTTWPFNGTMNGGTEVQLTDAFFNDPDAVKNTYVIPLVIASQTGFGKILSGTLKEGAQPVRTDASQWDVAPMDYILYCVKYQNKYAGWWLTHGTTSIDDIEKAGTVQLKTRSLTSCVYTVTHTREYHARTYDKDGKEVEKVEQRPLSTDLLLTFNANEQCTITTLTEGHTVSGSGSWTDDGVKKSWNNKDRDLMEISYTIDYGYDDYGNHIQGAEVHQKMVWERSGVVMEEFSPIYTK